MLSNHPNVLGGNGPSASSDLIGDVDGPASATDNAVARFDGTTGKLIQNSVVTIADTTGAIAGAQSLTSPASTNLTLAGGSSGASLVLGQGANGAITTTLPGTGLATVVGTITAIGSTGVEGGVLRVRNNTTSVTTAPVFVLGINRQNSGIGALYLGSDGNNNAIISTGNGTLRIGNETAGTFTEYMKLAVTTGDVNISSTTAGAASAGALVVAGGIYAGAASVFGSTATFGSTSTNPYGSSTLYAKGTVSAPASSGTANTSSFRAGAGNNIVADFGITTTGGNAAYIQAHDQSDQSVNYGLQIQPNGGTTTFGTGAATFAGAVTAVSVNSATGSVSAPTATATTIFAASTRGMYQVFAYIDAYDPTSWAATAVVINTGEASTLKITATNNPSFTLTVSGLNVQVTQSGGSTLSVEWRYLRIQ